RKAVRLIRMLRMQGLINAAQERTALDEVGAPGERVLPDREVPRPTAPAGPASEQPGEPAAHEPHDTPSPSELVAPPAAAAEPEPPSPAPEPAAEPGAPGGDDAGPER